MKFKSFLTASILFVFIQLLLIDIQAQTNLNDLDVQYDKFKDVTTVSTKPTQLLNDSERYEWGLYIFQMFGQYQVQGSVGQQPQTVKLAFYTASKRPFFSTASDRTVNMIIEGRRVSLGEMKYSGLKSWASTGYQESAWVEMTVDDYNTLSTAASVEVQMGRLEFKLSLSQLEAIRKLTANLQLQNNNSNSSSASTILPNSTSSTEKFVYETAPEPYVAKQIVPPTQSADKILNNVLGKWTFANPSDQKGFKALFVKIDGNYYFLTILGNGTFPDLFPIDIYDGKITSKVFNIRTSLDQINVLKIYFDEINSDFVKATIYQKNPSGESKAVFLGVRTP